MRYILFLIFYFISFSHIKAQRNFTLGDLKTPYSYRVNPAISPTCKFYLSMPLLGFQSIQFTNSAFSIHQMIFLIGLEKNHIFLLNLQIKY